MSSQINCNACINPEAHYGEYCQECKEEGGRRIMIESFESKTEKRLKILEKKVIGEPWQKGEMHDYLDACVQVKFENLEAKINAYRTYQNNCSYTNELKEQIAKLTTVLNNDEIDKDYYDNKFAKLEEKQQLTKVIVLKHGTYIDTQAEQIKKLEADFKTLNSVLWTFRGNQVNIEVVLKNFFNLVVDKLPTSKENREIITKLIKQLKSGIVSKEVLDEIRVRQEQIAPECHKKHGNLEGIDSTDYINPYELGFDDTVKKLKKEELNEVKEAQDYKDLRYYATTSQPIQTKAIKPKQEKKIDWRDLMDYAMKHADDNVPKQESKAPVPLVHQAECPFCHCTYHCEIKKSESYFHSKYLVLKLQNQLDIVKLQNEIHELIHGDTAIGISVKWLDVAEALLKSEIKE